MGTEGGSKVVTGRVFSTLPRLPKGTKNHHCTTRVMVAASLHMLLYSFVESTQRLYSVRLFFVSARTNKSHHHLWHPAHCPMGTVPRVLVRRTALQAYTDFGGLCSGAVHVVVRLEVVPLQPRSSAPTVAGCRLGGYPAGRDQWGGKHAAGGMSEDHDRCLLTLVLIYFAHRMGSV